MKVSIAMATYNGAQYIEEQLQSFLSQTRQPDELIISDDCSTDKTEEIVLEFAKSAPFRVYFFRNEKNLGYCGNFNNALMKTTGDLVFLSDQDDVWFPEKIKHMLSVAYNNPKALVLMNDSALTDSDLNEVGLTKIGQICSSGLGMSSFVMGCCCAVRREILNICLPILDGAKAHDDWIVEFAEGLNAKFVDPVVLQYYRRHESNASQFIANRTVRVTKSKTIINGLKAIRQNGVADRARLQVEQLHIFAKGIARARGIVSDDLIDNVVMLEMRVNEQIEVCEKRIRIREKSILHRFLLVSFLFISGGYSRARGFKSALRDIIG